MSDPEVIQISRRKFLIGCALAGAVFYRLGNVHLTSSFWVATELFATILSLFFLGSFRYQLDKNALTYGMGGVILATFWPIWWPSSELRVQIATHGLTAWVPFIHQHFLTLDGLEEFIHADTMLFILGLTYFVSVIAQSRLLETVSGVILKKQQGRVLPTTIWLTVLVAILSAFLGGVSMIGLMIRTLVIILALGRAETRDIIFAVIVSTVLTTVCGVFLAYGEPPNLIMKANLMPFLDNLFFVRYGIPVAVGSYLVVAWNLRKRLGGRKINMPKQDILDAYNADVRFLQASRHGEVFTPLEFIENQKETLGKHYIPVQGRVLLGEPLGEAFIREEIPLAVRKELLGHYVSEDLANDLEKHYQHMIHEEDPSRDESEGELRRALLTISRERRRSQQAGIWACLWFTLLLITHTFYESIPLFTTSCIAFAAAWLGIAQKQMRTLALKDAWNEYKEYFFLFPLFISINLLQKTGFFNVLAQLLTDGIRLYGVSHIAYVQYWAACLLSAILDNNIVADFASKALHGLDLGTLHLFSMAQIAGYAVGGCWTHIGCAQSVVAFAYIRKEISPRYTPVEWMRSMTGVILQMSAVITLLIYLEGWLLAR